MPEKGNRVALTVLDPNTLKLSARLRSCDLVRVEFDIGRVVELVPAGCPH